MHLTSAPTEIHSPAQNGAALEPSGPPDVDRLARILSALADPTRLRIVALVARRELSGNEVAEALGISRALACHHLTRLVECGLVRRRREGQVKLVMLNRELLGVHLAQVLRVAGVQPG